MEQREGKLLCLGFDGTELNNAHWKELDKIVNSHVLVNSPSDIGDNVDTKYLFVRLGAKVEPDLIDRFPSLKYIGMLGTGYGGIDTDYAAKKGIAVTNIADYATQAVTEFTFGILLEYLRDISKARTQAGKGDYSDDFSGSEIKGKRFGVVGMGAIGKRTAQLASAFGADVHYWSRTRKLDVEANGVKYADLDQLLGTCDIVTLNLALNSETEGIIDRQRLNTIKQGAIVINPSPMELFDFEALVRCLKERSFVFMLDHSDEMTDEQLQTLAPLRNAIIYPAIAYLTNEASQQKKQIFVDNLKNFLKGKPTNKVN